MGRLKKEDKPQVLKPLRNKKSDMLIIEAMIYKKLVEGWSYNMIGQYMIDNYGYKNIASTNFTVGKVSRSIFSNRPKEELYEAQERFFDMYLDIYRKAYEKGDYKTALNTLNSMARMRGLLQEKINETQINDFIVTFSNDK